MHKTEWEEQLVKKLEACKDEISPSDFRFYNIAHLPLIAKMTSKEASHCSDCVENMRKISRIVDELPDVLVVNAADRKHFEDTKNEIEKHLRKSHRYYFPGYFAAAGSLAGMLVGIFAAWLIIYVEKLPLFNKLSILSIGLALLLGWFIGTAIDKKYFRRNLQL